MRTGKPILSELSLNWESEIHICSSKLDQLLGDIQDFSVENRSNEHRKIYTRLLHVLQRVERVPVTYDDRSQLLNLANSLFEKLQSVYNASVQSPVAREVSILDSPNPLIPEVVQAPVNNLGYSSNEGVAQLVDAPISERASNPQAGSSNALHSHHSTAMNVELAARLNELNFATLHRDPSGPSPPPVPLYHHANYVPISRWNLKFDGESSSVSAFLEKVEELRYSRGVSKQQLLQAASEIFTGSALFWFRSIRQTITDWDQLVRKLKDTFLPYDYETSLWNEIRSRTQHKTEKVAVYIAIMENLFSRLPEKPPMHQRVAIIRKNLQPNLVSFSSAHVFISR